MSMRLIISTHYAIENSTGQVKIFARSMLGLLHAFLAVLKTRPVRKATAVSSRQRMDMVQDSLKNIERQKIKPDKL